VEGSILAGAIMPPDRPVTLLMAAGIRASGIVSLADRAPDIR